MIKKALKSAFPGLYHDLSHRFGEPARYLRVGKAVVERFGRKVNEGPFQGMVYGDKAAGSAYTPKILGTYELELRPWVDEVIRADYTTIIDLGCAEGYYAIGLAMRCPNATIYAFDGDPDARAACQEMAKLNGVDKRVHIGGFCDVDTMKALPLEKAMLICDVEGHELDLLSPELIPVLKTIDIIVEFHELLRPGSTATIIERFKPTHDITVLTAVDRDPEKFPQIHFLPPADRTFALTESRAPGQQFAFFKVKGS